MAKKTTKTTKTTGASAAKKRATAADRLIDAAQKVSELEQNAARAAEAAQTAAQAAVQNSVRLASQAAPPNTWKRVAIFILLLWLCVHFCGRGCDRIKNFADQFRPFGWISRLDPDTGPINRKRERRQRGDRKTRPDTDPDADNRGIIWNWTHKTEAARDLAAWVRRTVPESASPDAIRDVGDAFYDAADRIADIPEIDQPAEAVAAAREKLLVSADRSWTPFLRGLDARANRAGIASIDDVVTFYYDLGDALYAAAGGLSAPAPAPEPAETAAPEQPDPRETPEPGPGPGDASGSDPQPPSDSTALPESAPPAPSSPAPPSPAPAPKKAAPQTQECPDGQCPINGGGNCPGGTCPNGNTGGCNYNYGYGGIGPFGWRWY